MRTSANTSINKRVPAVFKKVDWQEGTINLDYGCGKYPEYATQYLAEQGVINVPYDPYNYITDTPRDGYYDTVTLSNVLNVVEDFGERVRILQKCKWYLKRGGMLYITVYEGDGTGEGRETKPDCWQENRKLKSYYDEVMEVFYLGYTKIKNGVMEVCNV